MQKQEIKQILSKKYDREDWKILTKKIFKNVEYFKEPKKIQTNNEKVLDFIQLGNLNLNDNKTVSLFELKLTKNLNIYKNKIELRNLVTKFIDQYSSHGVLVVFDNQGSDYRLTFSSKYSDFDQEGNIIEVETAPKRYTYLLGENESCVTPAERLHLLSNQKDNLKIEDILSAFNVDKITDDFFNTYKKLYLKLYDELENLIKKDKNIKNTFEENKITIEEFSKKLLGQLIFIYFLQKKGWLGIKKNEDSVFKKWGSGDKNFIRNLFDKKYCKYDNFFNDVLEPLFVAFSTDLPENYYSKLDTKIPFLNGGLFDPIKNYNWLDTKITISNGLIYEILDNFEMYNFTIQEEDPEEKEVAIDPEMLGKVFENLLDIKDKKSKGTFYTPRKIAKYICEEALINYLINEVGDNDKATINQLVKNIYNFKQNNFIKKNYQLIDEKIKNIKICDPAIGSGEFPVELMNLCVSIRLSLNNFYNDKKRTSYLLKRNFIRNSIYGVDIEDSAIETAKLRLWLSLILDEEDYDKILPLPNLDYKIFKGDSLLSLESNLLGFEKKDEIALLKNEYFQTTNIKKKLELKKKIDFQFNSIMDGQVSFDFKIFFQEVFDQKQGFDLIVGNPPYVQIQKIKDRLYKSNLKNEYKVFTGNADLYCLFFEKGRELLNDKGCLAYITSNKWLKSAYGSLLRNFFLDKCNIIQLIDFKSLQIFKKASVDTSIVLLKKGSSKTIKACEISDFDKYQNFEMTLKNENITLKRENLLSSWAISHGDENLLLTKIKNIKNKLDLPRNKFRRGITTGLNSVFLINEKVRKQLINEDKKNQFLIKKIVRGKNMYKYTYDKGLDYLLYIPWHFPLDVEGINGASDEAELAFKKEYKSLYKYLSNFKEDLKRRNEQETGIRYEWYVLQRPGTSFVSDFNQTKVGWMNMNRGWKFSLIDKDIFLEASCNFVADNEYAKYLVGIYSSNVHKWYFKKVGRMFDDGGYMCKVDTISEFPVVKPSSNEKIKIEKMVDLLINSPNEQNERNLNNYIYELYGLNNKEKAIVDTIK